MTTIADLFIQDIVLENDVALLRPMHPADYEGLKAIAFDKSIWAFTLSRIYNEHELTDYMKLAASDRTNDIRYAFTIIDKATGNVAGSTSFLNVSIKDLRLEIGATWLGTAYKGTGLNSACKQLLLTYAFEKLEMQRVEIKTDSLNTASRKAILKLGAKEEGTLRSHGFRHDGYRRDAVYYSILADEWHDVKKD